MKKRIRNLGDIEKELALKYINILSDFTSKEGWNQSKYDCEAFFELDPRGYWVLEICSDDNKWEPAVMTWCSLDESSLQMAGGLFINLKPELRKHGLGGMLFDEAYQKVSTDYNAWGSGVLQMVKYYESKGYADDGGIIRHTITRLDGKLSSRCFDFRQLDEKRKEQTMKFVSDTFSPCLAKYISVILRNDKESLLNVYIDDGEEEDQVMGVGMARRLQERGSLGVFFVSHLLDITTTIFKDLSARVQGRFDAVIIDIRENTPLDLWMKNTWGTNHKLFVKDLIRKGQSAKFTNESYPHLAHSFFGLKKEK